MFDYIRVFENEAAAIDGCPRLGGLNGDGVWQWSTVGVSVVTLRDVQGEVIPGFVLMISRPELDDDLAEVSQLELNASFGPTAQTLSDCVLRFDPSFTAIVASVAPMWMDRRYPVPDPL